jgi:excisionase family DNA binding protein
VIADEVANWLSLDEVASQLGLSTSRVRRLIEEHVLFAVKIEKQLMVPADLIVDGEPLASVRGTMLQLMDIGLSEPEAIDWLYADNEYLGEKPILALRKGHKAPVRRAAQNLG